MTLKNHFSVYKGLPKNMYLLFISVIINKVGSFVMPLMTLILTEKIGLSEPDAGLFTSVSMLAQAPFIIYGGRLVDKLGSKKVITIFNLLGAMVYLVCGFIEPSKTLTYLLIIASLLYSTTSSAINSLVANITPAPLLKNAYSLIYLGYNLGFAIGPILGGLLFNNYLYLLFIFNALATILSTLFILFFITENKETSDARVHTQEDQLENETTGRIFSFFQKNYVIIMFSVALLIYNFCYIQWSFLLPLQAVDIFGENGAGYYSLLVSINAITVIVLTPVITSFTQKMAPLLSIIIGGLFYVASFAMFSFNKILLAFIFTIIVLTIGEILIAINTNNYIAQRTPRQYLGRVNSIIQVLNGTGYSIGPFIMGSIIISQSHSNAWLIVSAIMLCGALFMYVVKRLDKVRDFNKQEDSPIQ